MYTNKDKKAAVAEYKQELADAAIAQRSRRHFRPGRDFSASWVRFRVGAVSAQAGPTNVELGPALAADSEAPRLPRELEPSVREPHREKNAWHPPGCIARKLSK